MAFTYENQGAYSYLVYELQENEELDTMSLGMITNNKIPGFTAASYTQMDEHKFIRYNISSKVSVKQFFEGTVNKKQLLSIFSNIVSAICVADDYMISPESLVLDLNYIYTDVSTYETVVVCLPIEKDAAECVDMGTFFKNIMFTSRFDQTENSDYVGKIINYLNSTTHFSLADFKELLNTLKQQGSVATPSPQTKVNPTPENVPSHPMMVESQSVQVAVQQSPVAGNRQPVPAQQPVIPQVVPQMIQQPVQQPIQKPEQGEQGEKISMFYLLSHYNKENAAKYKEQKGKAGTEAKQSKTDKKQAAKQSAAFAIPGQNTGFAVPGQPVVPQNKATQSAVVQNRGGGANMGQPGNQQMPQQPQPQSQPQQMQASAGIQGGISNSGSVAMAVSSGFGETTVLGISNNGETTVLSANMMQQVERKPYLVRTKNNEKIAVDKVVFRIGKEKNYVDYFIADNTAVSRSHANIITRDGAYFVMDTNSTNHTYVNGIIIGSNMENPIVDGDKIRFANEEFTFQLL